MMSQSDVTVKAKGQFKRHLHMDKRTSTRSDSHNTWLHRKVRSHIQKEEKTELENINTYKNA